MAFKFFMTGLLATLPFAVSAQAGPVPVKTPAQIACEINGDCDVIDQSDATVDQPDAPEMVGKARVAGQTRGFRFELPVKANKPKVPAVNGGYVSTRVSPKVQSQRQSASRPARAVKPKGALLPINFMSGSATISPGSIPLANSLITALKDPKFSGKRFIVAGHTDSVGSREYNLDLSKRRAEALIDFMVQNGIDRSSLQAEGYGFDKPIEGYSAKSAANRRVEVVKID